MKQEVSTGNGYRLPEVDQKSFQNSKWPQQVGKVDVGVPNLDVKISFCLIHEMTDLLFHINKYGSYLLIRDWASLKWRPVLKV